MNIRFPEEEGHLQAQALLASHCYEQSAMSGVRRKDHPSEKRPTHSIKSLEGASPLGPKNVKHRTGGSTVMDHWLQDGAAWKRYVAFLRIRKKKCCAVFT